MAIKRWMTWLMAAAIVTAVWVAPRTFAKVTDIERRIENAWRFFGAGLHEVGIDELEAAEKGAPANPEVALGLAVAYDAMGRWDDAAAHYEKVIALDKTYGPVAALLGDMQVRRGRFADAAKAYARALAAQSDLAKAQFGMGLVAESLGAQGKWPVALGDPVLEKAAGLSADWRQEAVGHYKRTLELAPDKVEAYLRLGVLLLGSDDANGALAQLKAGAKINGHIPEMYYQMGRAYEALGRPQAAIKAYERSLDLAPNYTQAQTRLKALRQP